MNRIDSRKRGGYRERAPDDSRQEGRGYSSNEDFGARFDEDPRRQPYGDDRGFSREGYEAYGRAEQDRYGDSRGGDREAGVNYRSGAYRSGESRGQARGDYDYDRDYYGGANRMDRGYEEDRRGGRGGRGGRNAEDDRGERFGGDRGGRSYGRGDDRGDRFEPTNRFDGRYGENRAYPYSGEGYGRPYDRALGEARGAEPGYRSGNDWNEEAGRDARRRRFDDQYLSWREKQIQQMDDDYETYMREHPDRRHQDFESWRSQGQTKGQGTQARSDQAKPKSSARTSSKGKSAAGARTTKATSKTAAKKTAASRKSGTASAKSSRATGSAAGSTGMASGMNPNGGGQTDVTSLQRR